MLPLKETCSVAGAVIKPVVYLVWKNRETRYPRLQRSLPKLLSELHRIAPLCRALASWSVGDMTKDVDTARFLGGRSCSRTDGVRFGGVTCVSAIIIHAALCRKILTTPTAPNDCTVGGVTMTVVENFCLQIPTKFVTEAYLVVQIKPPSVLSERTAYWIVGACGKIGRNGGFAALTLLTRDTNAATDVHQCPNILTQIFAGAEFRSLVWAPVASLKVGA